MSNVTNDAGAEEYAALGGINVLITAASVEQTGLVPGAVYEFTAVDGTACCRWDTTAATSADGGFTFVVGKGETKRVRNPAGNTLLNVIESDAGSVATAVLLITRVLNV
jgi:hypothetical protein